jgi:hypothetical protein
MISMDLHAKKIDLNVPAAELAKRKKGWKAPAIGADRRPCPVCSNGRPGQPGRGAAIKGHNPGTSIWIDMADRDTCEYLSSRFWQPAVTATGIRAQAKDAISP